MLNKHKDSSLPCSPINLGKVVATIEKNEKHKEGKAMYIVIDTRDNSVVALRHTFRSACKEACERNLFENGDYFTVERK